MKLKSGDNYYFTVSEMAKLENTSVQNIGQRLARAGKKPAIREALYTQDAYDAIKGARKMGRPRLPEEEILPASLKRRKTRKGTQ